MVHAARSLALLAALLLLPLAAPAAQDEHAVVVRGPGAERAAQAAGARVVDAEGAVATAHASPQAIAALQRQGFVVEPWAQRTGRGMFHFDPAQGDGVVPAALRSDLGTRSLVAFRGPVRQEWRDALARTATVYDYLPRDSFVVRGGRDALGSVPGVAFVGPYHAGYKLAPGLVGSGPREVSVLTFPDADVQRVARDVAGTGAEVRSTASVAGLEGIVRARADGAQAAAIAQLDDVAWLERAPGPAGEDNEHAAAIVQDGDPALRGLNALGLDGSTQLVSICDTGVDTQGTGTTRSMVHDMFADPAHPDVVYQQPNPLHRKVALYYSPVEAGVTDGDFLDGSSHGTHTAGTLAGDVAPFGQADLHDSGAYAARLAICDITTGSVFRIPGDYSTMWQPAYDLGARVNSNSWGSDTTFDYTDVARQHDAYVAQHRDFLIARSAGNTGAQGLRPEALAKDVLAVASGKNAGSGNIEDLSAFSSTGPAADGRLKPDVTAPGECLMSAMRDTTDQYQCLSGTSMATPTAAAGAALLRDAFAKGWFPGVSDPSAALLRAMLFASGHEMTGAGAHQGLYAPQLAAAPDGGYLVGPLTRVPAGPAGTFPNPQQGWGRLNLSAVLGASVRDEGAGLATGQQRTFTVHAAGGQPLRVVLAWTDAPGAAGANPALVNDLDLTVTDPTGLAYPGNLWLQDQSAPLPLPDHVNNAEGVGLGAPAAGDWTITVTGADVPTGPQSFALVVTGAD